MQRISIDPITRLEGHGKIDIFLNDEGEVANAYFQIPELRGFEKFCVGRQAEDMPNLTDRICGVCPEAHHIASSKALDALFPVDPEAPVAERNILGVIQKVGMEVAGKVLKMRRDGHNLIMMMSGRRVQPNWGLPGGVSRGITEEQRREIEARGREAIDFALFSLQAFRDIVLGNKAYVDLILSDTYTHHTYSMGMVDAQNKVNFYDALVRVVDPDGKEFVKYAPRESLDVLAEHVEPWSYLKFPYLKKVGWKGLVDGKDSGVYKCTPLSRLNAADGRATPRAQGGYEG